MEFVILRRAFRNIGKPLSTFHQYPIALSRLKNKYLYTN
jgi:hypothetical protein